MFLWLLVLGLFGCGDCFLEHDTDDTRHQCHAAIMVMTYKCHTDVMLLMASEHRPMVDRLCWCFCVTWKVCLFLYLLLYQERFGIGPCCTGIGVPSVWQNGLRVRLTYSICSVLDLALRYLLTCDSILCLLGNLSNSENLGSDNHPRPPHTCVTFPVWQLTQIVEEEMTSSHGLRAVVPKCF